MLHGAEAWIGAGEGEEPVGDLRRRKGRSERVRKERWRVRRGMEERVKQGEEGWSEKDWKESVKTVAVSYSPLQTISQSVPVSHSINLSVSQSF